MTFDDWLKIGFDNGWVGAPVCDTHDGLPISEAEERKFEEGGDPCIHIMRLYDNLEDRLAVEENHSPSVWRATNAGLGISPLE